MSLFCSVSQSLDHTLPNSQTNTYSQLEEWDRKKVPEHMQYSFYTFITLHVLYAGGSRGNW